MLSPLHSIDYVVWQTLRQIFSLRLNTQSERLIVSLDALDLHLQLHACVDKPAFTSFLIVSSSIFVVSTTITATVFIEVRSARS